MDKPRPYVTAAMFCEKVLVEKDEVVSVMRMIDNMQYRLEGPGLPENVKAALNVQALISLKAGPVEGEHTVSLVLEKPTGERKEVFSTTLKFLTPDQGQNLIASMTIGVDEDGLFWMDVLFDGEVLTRTPLKITRQETPASQAPASQVQTP